MAFKGDLKSMPLGDVLQTLAHNAKSGILEVKGPGIAKSLHCTPQGITLLNPGVKNRRRFGDIVVSAGLVPRDAVEEAVRAAEAEKKPLGRVLVERNLLPEEAVGRILKIQIEEEIFRLFALRTGEFTFQADGDGEGPPENENLPYFDMRSLLLEAARRLDEWQCIRKHVDDFDTIFIRVADPAGEEDPAARKILGQVDGRRTVHNISDGLLESPFEVAKIMSNLARDGKIRRADKQELLHVAQALLDEGEIEAGGRILRRLRPKIENIILDEGDVSTLADLFHKVGDILTATNILLDKVRESKEKSLLEEGIPFLKKALAIAPEDTRILKELARIAAQTGDKEGRLQYLIALAKTQLKQEKFDALLETCLEILDVSPGNTYVLEEVPDHATRCGDRTGAADFLEALAERSSKRLAPPELAGLYRHVLKLAPSRKEVQVRLARLQRSSPAGRRRLVQAAGMAVIVLGGICSFFINTRDTEPSTEMNTVERAALLFTRDNLEEARNLLQGALGTMKDEDALAEARALLQMIARKEKEGREFQQTLEENRYQKAMGGVWSALEGGAFDRVFTQLAEIARSFPGAKYSTSTRKETAKAALELEHRIKAFEADFSSFDEPRLDEEVPESLERLAAMMGRHGAEALQNLDRTLSAPLPEAVSEALPEGFRAEVKKTAGTAGDYLALLDRLAHRKERLEKLAGLSHLLEEARAAEKEGRLADAFDRYDRLVEAYTEGPLKVELTEKRNALKTFFDGVQEVHTLAEAGRLDEAYRRAEALMKAYPDPAHRVCIRFPVQIRSSPAGARILSDGGELGRAPRVIYIAPGAPCSVVLDQEGFARASRTVRAEGGPVRTIILDRETAYTLDLGEGNLVEGRPLRDGGKRILATRRGLVCVVDGRTGRLLAKRDARSLSGIQASIIRAHGRYYFHTGEGKVCALDPDTLEELAARELSAGTDTAPLAVEGGIVSASNDGKVIRLSPDLDAVDWTFQGPGVPVDVLSSENRVFAAYVTGEVICLDAETGSELWRYGPVKGGLVGAAVAGGRLVLASAGGRLVALSEKTGTGCWETALPASTGFAPAIAGETVFAAANDRVVAVNAADGAVLRVLPAGGTVCTALSAKEGFLCYGTRDGLLHYRRWDGTEDRWTYRSRDRITSVPLLEEERVLVVDRSGLCSAVVR